MLRGMDSTIFMFNKDIILERLKSNREEHLMIVREAQKGFREKLQAILENKLEDLKAGHEVNLHIGLHIPSNHVDDFDRIIEMLEMCIDDDIKLNQDDFQCYIRNRWHWNTEFLASNRAYSETAASIAGELPPINSPVGESY
jgi:hypothetical protein